jgi:hypothetical protein
LGYGGQVIVTQGWLWLMVATCRYLVSQSLLLLATILEAGGDAIIRIGLMPRGLSRRIAVMLAGGAVLYCY